MKNKENINIQDKAKEVGIDGMVEIDNEVIRNLIPSSFLKNLGLTLEQRIENLLLLVKASLNPKETDLINEKAHYIPFTLLRGPFVREDTFSIVVKTCENDTSRVITIHKVQEDNQEC